MQLDGKEVVVSLRDVLYVPKLAQNLVSVSKATTKSLHVEFHERECFVRTAQNRTLARGVKEGNLYKLLCTA